MKEQLLLGLIFTCIMTGAFYAWASTPVVQYSWSTNECVAVLFDDNHTCENLPTRYTKEWVK